jgi:hypothetical protein
VIVIVNVVPAVSVESNPAELFPLAARWVHGFSKLDCVTECVKPWVRAKLVKVYMNSADTENEDIRTYSRKYQVTLSPTWAVIFG